MALRSSKVWKSSSVHLCTCFWPVPSCHVTLMSAMILMSLPFKDVRLTVNDKLPCCHGSKSMIVNDMTLWKSCHESHESRFSRSSCRPVPCLAKCLDFQSLHERRSMSLTRWLCSVAPTSVRRRPNTAFPFELRSLSCFLPFKRCDCDSTLDTQKLAIKYVLLYGKNLNIASWPASLVDKAKPVDTQFCSQKISFLFDSLANSSVFSPTVIASHWASVRIIATLTNLYACVAWADVHEKQKTLPPKNVNSRYSHGEAWLYFVRNVTLTALRREFVRAVQHLRFAMPIYEVNRHSQGEISIRSCCSICHVSLKTASHSSLHSKKWVSAAENLHVCQSVAEEVSSMSPASSLLPRALSLHSEKSHIFDVPRKLCVLYVPHTWFRVCSSVYAPRWLSISLNSLCGKTWSRSMMKSWLFNCLFEALPDLMQTRVSRAVWTEATRHTCIKSATFVGWLTIFTCQRNVSIHSTLYCICYRCQWKTENFWCLRKICFRVIPVFVNEVFNLFDF